MIGITLAAALGLVELRPMPRPAAPDPGSVLIVNCGAVAAEPPAVLLGADRDQIAFVVTLNGAGVWQLGMVLPDGGLCGLGAGGFLGISPEIRPEGDPA